MAMAMIRECRVFPMHLLLLVVLMGLDDYEAKEGSTMHTKKALVSRNFQKVESSMGSTLRIWRTYGQVVYKSEHSPKKNAPVTIVFCHCLLCLPHPTPAPTHVVPCNACCPWGPLVSSTVTPTSFAWAPRTSASKKVTR